MAGQKPPVPPNHITFMHWEELYFGDDKLQAQSIQTLLDNNVPGSAGNITLVVGPTRTGKNTVFEEATEKLEKLHPTIKIVTNDDLEGFDKKITFNPRRHNVIQVNTDAPICNLHEDIEEARKMLIEYPNSSVVIEGLTNEPRIPGMETAIHKGKVQHDEKELAALLRQNPDITLVRTKHNVNQVQEALWNLNEKLGIKYSKTGDTILKEIFHGFKNAELDKVIEALNEHNKEKYDLAFERIRSRMTQLQ